MKETHQSILPALLIRAASAAIRSIVVSVSRKGWKNICAPEVQLIMAILRGTVSPSDIATELGITRQAIHQTICDLIARGYIEMKVNTRDRRRRILSLTAEGARLAFDIDDAFKRVELAMKDQDRKELEKLAGLYLGSATVTSVQWPNSITPLVRGESLQSQC